MSKVFFSVAVSVDGFIAPEGMTLEHADDPDYNDWLAQWSRLQYWALQQRFSRKNLWLGDDDETGPDNELLEATFARTGATVLGKRMFEGGERFWPEEAPFHTPVYVLTHHSRDPWERPGGTTFYFVTDGIESALEQAREAAGDRDVRIGGGADTIVQLLNAGLVDEFTLSVSPVVLGSGIRLFAGIDRRKVVLEHAETIAATPAITHLRYTVSSR